jgi:hypothetical protein
VKKYSISIYCLLGLLPLFSQAGNLIFESTARQTALLELYTSEGCSSCPPADRWISTLLEKKGLWTDFIPIALHVDYWDYIGWKDRFAKSEHSLRQRQYAHERSIGSVYTPGFIYNGQEWRNWYGSRSSDFPNGNTPGILKLELEGRQANIIFSPAASVDKKLQVYLALLGFDLSTSVKAGENAGKNLAHNFVVLAINHTSLQSNSNQYSARLAIPDSSIVSSRHGIVAWISAADRLTPLQSVGGWLNQ